MHLKTMVRKTLDKFERLKTETEVDERCHFCTDTENALGQEDCNKCKLAERVVDKGVRTNKNIACVAARHNGARKPRALYVGIQSASWEVPPLRRRYNWLNGFVDFLQEWLDELEGRSK